MMLEGSQGRPASKCILLAEDSQQDAELILAALSEHRVAHLVALVRDGEQALDYLLRRGEFAGRPAGNPDVVLLDLTLPKRNALELLKFIRGHADLSMIPVVVLSASRDQGNLVECYQNGVNAYVVKPVDFHDFGEAVAQLGLFWTAINVPPPLPSRSNLPGPASPLPTRLRILHLEGDPSDVARVKSALQAAELACQLLPVETREAFLAALEEGGVQLVLADSAVGSFEGMQALDLLRARWPEVPFVLVADELEEASMEQLLSQATDFVCKDRLSRLAPAVRRALLEVEWRAARASLEAGLIVAQKMDVIGQLAGGVAHDFNNLLAVFMGTSELLELELEPHSPLRMYTEEMRLATDLGAGLVRQLLTFSRKQTIQPVVLDLNAEVSKLEKLMRRLIQENIEISIVAGQQVGSIRADPVYVAQLLMNLVINARDAMPQGGRLILETSHGPHPAGIAGDYVVLTVSDSGCGLDEEVKQKIFDPFFTTKSLGQGTGLGLATCQTILRQCQGYITVASEPGKGTCFTLYFPRLKVIGPSSEPAPRI